MPFELLNWIPKLTPIKVTWQETEEILKEIEDEKSRQLRKQLR